MHVDTAKSDDRLTEANSAEFAYEDFIRSEWQGPSADRLHEQERNQHDEWVSMSPKERLLRWTLKHKYQVVFGSWATGDSSLVCRADLSCSSDG